MQSMQVQMPEQGPYPLHHQQQIIYHYTQPSQPYHQQQYSSLSRTTTAQTDNNNTSYSPPPPTQFKEKRSRRWSLAGRFFDKRKSVAQPINRLPGTLNNNQQQQQQQQQQPLLTIKSNHGNISNNGPYPDEQRVSPVGSGGSGGSSGSNHCGAIGSGCGGGGNGSCGHRRSSLADIPKALFSSLRRGTHSSSSETNSSKEPVHNGVPKSVQQQYQQQQQRGEWRAVSPASSYEGYDADSTTPDGGDDQDYSGQQEIGFNQQQQSVSATILTANGLMQATMAVPKAPPPCHTIMATKHLPPTPVKGILKKRSPPSPRSQQLLSYKMQLIINRSSSCNSSLVHPMAVSDGQVGGLLHATKHRARLETSSPIPSHPQPMQSCQQQQQQSQPGMKLSSACTPAPGGIQTLLYPTTSAHYTGYGSCGKKNIGNTITTTPTSGMPPKLGSTVELNDRYLSHYGGAAFPPDFTPGMQSNVYQDRGGERSQGQVLDYRMMEMDPSFSLQGTTLPPPPLAVAAAAASAAHGFHYQSSHSREYEQYCYGGACTGHDQDSSMMDGSHRPMTMTMMSEINGEYGYSNGGSYNGSSMRRGSRINESTVGILSGNGISLHRTRSIGFADTIEIIPAHRKSEYNRRSDKYATFRNLTPDLKSEIRDELNVYKMREMAVHVESMGNTTFH